MRKSILFLLLWVPVYCYAGINTAKLLSFANHLPAKYQPSSSGFIKDDSTQLLQRINHGLNAYTNQGGIEKVYLHLDKSYYASGDTIYFKSYVTIGPEHKLSALSGVLNVDLIKPDEKIYRSIKLKLTDGVAWGDFTLDDTLKTGNYRIRAYTNWMRNANSDYFFNKSLLIVNGSPSHKKSGNLKNITSDKTSKAIFYGQSHSKYGVQFFPEGGSLINGVLSKMAFKAISSNGLGTGIKGAISDNEGHEIVTLSSQHLGMGDFTFNPESGKTYKATITFEDGSTSVFDLPKASDTGYSLAINNLDSTQLRINITVGKTTPAAQIFLVAQAGGVIYYTAKSSAGAKDINAVVPQNRFPTGIVQFTLFSSTGEPLNERLVFINNNDQIRLNTNTLLQSYSSRQKVKINLYARNKNGQPATGLFSVSVTDETKAPVNETTENNIFSSLLLTSDLKGYIEQPSYYFTNISDKTRSDLDVLMLTQGYHRFEWKQILSGNPPSIGFQPEKSLHLSGTIKSRWGKPIPKTKISLLSTKSALLLKDTITDANGRFVFTRLLKGDSLLYLLQVEDKKFRQNSSIIIDSTTAPIEKNRVSPVIDGNPDSALLIYSRNSEAYHTEQDKQGIGRHAIALKEVVIKDKKQLKYLEHSSNLRGPGNADQVITADRLPVGCPVFVDCIRTILHSVNFYTNNVPGKKPPLIIIDGMALNNSDKASDENRDILNSIDMSNVASIEVLSNASTAAVYGVRAGGGVVIITTKQGDDIDYPINNSAKGMAIYSANGYYKARVFYSPRYDVAKADTAHPDLRTTIYWNPNLITGQDGKTSFEFFNADGKGTYRVVIEGIDDKGNLGRQVYRYKVE